MSVPLHKLRDEARLLEDRIEAAETTARHCRGLAAITPHESVVCEAIARAESMERAAKHMASRLSRIAQTLGGIL